MYRRDIDGPPAASLLYHLLCRELGAEERALEIGRQ
jgi:hypothetical protein